MRTPRPQTRHAAACLSALLTLLALGAAGSAVAHPYPPGAAEEPEPIREAYPEAAPPADRQIQAERNLSPLVQRLLDDPLLTPQERVELRLAHGDWSGLAPTDPTLAAQLALAKWDLHHPALQDPQAPAVLRARAARRLGQPGLALYALGDDDSETARLERALANLDLGQTAPAVEALAGVRERARGDALITADQLTAAAQSILLLHQLEGAAGLSDHRLATALLARVRNEVDPLHAGARALEAHIFFGKADVEAAEAAAQEALSLNPNHGTALLALGLESVRRFNFAGAAEIIQRLRAVQAGHPLADRIEAASLLKQKDPAAARAVLDHALGQRPYERALLRLRAQADALAYQDAALARTETRHRRLAGEDPRFHKDLAELYRDARQYDQALQRAAAALALRPGWSEPLRIQAEALMQDGRIDQAVASLRAAQTADPTHRDIANYLRLARQMAGWPTIETDHFVVRHSPPAPDGTPHPDAAWARDLARRLDGYHETFATLYQHELSRKTQIDVMPNDDAFAVRIMGLPQVFTVGACTGDVIVLTAPRAGAERQFEFYDWPLVFLHEYAHVVSLGKTANRIPHWFTEGLAVDQETTGRTYDRQRMLAGALADGSLMPIRKLTWGFIRPQNPGQRALAYAQSHWVLEFLTERFGPDTAVRMMDLQAQGLTDVDSLEAVAGQTHDQIMQDFLAWADGQTESWGLAASGVGADDATALAAVLRTVTGGDADAASSPLADLADLADRLPNHPDVLLALAQVALQAALEAHANEDENEAASATREAQRAMDRYHAARPADPWVLRAQARLARAAGDLDTEAQALQGLDRLESSSAFAARLADLHASRNEPQLALDWIMRAMDREPYNAAFRERAVRYALLAQDFDEALHHLVNLAVLEPDTPDHQVRLAYLYDRLGQDNNARAAAERAKELNPSARVDRFLKDPPSVTPEPTS
ncbi:MAG: hypothetical protein AAGA57_00555 [Planctomycetota bacterium]